MDPNSGKKNMFNKLSKKQCLEALRKEDFNRTTISFYKYVLIDSLPSLRDQLYSEWLDLQILGRIYIAQEGINAQLSIPDFNLEKFRQRINSYSFLKDVPFKIAVDNNYLSFFKLTIKIKEKIVEDGLSIRDYDFSKVGDHLNAKQWNEAIDRGAILVDMRNHYESEIGKFVGAICPQTETFKEELPIVKDILHGKESKEILLYCTGGIRCEKASAYLNHHGFKNVNQLHGGIIDYVNQLKKDDSLENKFIGKNFVFDERRSERVSEDVISKCHQCGSECDQHVNCENVNCNLLFIQCDNCRKSHQNCCSIECMTINNLPESEKKKLRKGKQNQKRYYRHKKIRLR
ncbi:MAG: hypothetical protein CMP51_02015 [Flavobacteriales bacterium]|nr:hypothetical protein [Flavobacteriales bacterium]